MPRKEGHLLVDEMGKNNNNIPWSMVKLLITLCIIHPVITNIQVSFQTQLPERKETTQGFHHEANGDFKTVTSYY
jgi:hypothetical protein